MKQLIWWFQRRFQQPSQWQEEIESHLAMRVDWHREQGLDPGVAQDRARRQFGNRTRTFEDVRAVHVRPWIDSLRQDVKHGLRGFRRSPMFTIVAVATLAIGIGTSTAVFSVVDPLLFRSLPYLHGDRLVSVGFTGPIDTNEFQMGGTQLDWKQRQTVFSSLTSMRPAYKCDLGSQMPHQITCVAVEANFLQTFGLAPALGRDFTKDDDRPGAPKVMLLAYGLWKQQFGSNPQVLGKTVDIDGEPVRIAGVLPASFEMPQLGEADVLLPEQLDPVAARAPNSTIFLRAFARLKDGVTIESAREQMLPLFEESVRSQVPPALRSEVHLVVRSLRDRRIHDVKLASWMLLGAVLALLALACANVTNLLLARAVARRKELAMRAAIGAGRARLIRQLLTESLMLGVLGCAAGTGLAWALVRFFLAISPEGVLRIDQARIDLRVLAFSLAASLLSALLFGLAPALERPRADALAGWQAAGPSRTLFRSVLVAAQVAISLLLLTGASLFARSLWQIESEPLGFQPERLVFATFTIRRSPPAAQSAMSRELEARLRQTPGGGAFALTDSIPPAGGMHARPYSNMRIAGHPPLGVNGGMVGFRYVTLGYFPLMRVPILAGRGFEEAERASGTSPLVLSASLARRMFGHENPVGQRIELSGDGKWSTVVGVAADVKNNGLSEAAGPEYYRLRMNDVDNGGRTATALFRTSLDLDTLARWIREEAAQVDPSMPLTIGSMETRVNHLEERPRFLAVLVGLFAMSGLLLSSVGLYGVMSFLVAQRTREIGVRMAIGATPGSITLLIQKYAGVWTSLGVAVGLASSVGLTRLVRGLLFRVSPYDPWSLGAALASIAIAAALAAWLPAHRAARVDPTVALRHD